MKFQISYPIEYLLKWMIYEALFSERDKRAYILFAIDGEEYMNKDNYTQYNEAFQVIYDTLHNITDIGFYSDFDVENFQYKFLYEWMNTRENVGKIVWKADILLSLFKGENDG